MPMAIGTAMIRAKIELSTVTWKRSRIPNRRLSASVVLNSVLVMKLAWLAPSDGIARISKNSAIRPIAPMMLAPAAMATDLKTRSPQRPSPLLRVGPLGGFVGISGVSTIFCGLAGGVAEPTEVESGDTDISSDYLRNCLNRVSQLLPDLFRD